MARANQKLCPGYCLIPGSNLDRALLVRTMQRTYQELHPGQGLAHLAHTVDQYLSHDSSLWWVDVDAPLPQSSAIEHRGRAKQPIACLWLGNAVDQIDGDRHTYIFLLYVEPNHRRRGIGTALMNHAAQLAQAKGDRKISLQVFHQNTPALEMYQGLGYVVQSVWMTKQLWSDRTDERQLT
ncbi:MAG: GNAT family N-acetyltransferase [Leptolyngbyaceae bacterium]|nr:GNAT family N-acetyltransferase [Leptolyngbyaceae bacterium]